MMNKVQERMKCISNVDFGELTPWKFISYLPEIFPNLLPVYAVQFYQMVDFIKTIRIL